MTRPKIGRNERCPCGSGEKYKRCCLQRLEAQRLDAAVPAHATPDIPELHDILAYVGRLRALVEDGGPLAGLRFDDRAFAAALNAHGEHAIEAHSDDRAPWEILMERCAPQLMDEGWLKRARRALLRVEGSNRLPREDRIAVAFARRVLPRHPSPDGFPSLLEMAVFPVQLGEYAWRGRELDEVMSELAEHVADPFDRAAMSEENRQLWSRAEQLVAGNPSLRATLAADMDHAVDRALAALTAPEPPALLRMEEQVRLWNALRLAADPDELLERLREVAEAAPLKRALVKRCADGLRDGSTPDEKRRWADLAIAVQTATDAVLLGILKNKHVQFIVEDDEEQRLIEACTREASSYEPWLDWLGACHGPEVAARAREDLRQLTS